MFGGKARCLDCNKMYRRWQQTCQKCGSHQVAVLEPSTDAEHFMNVPLHRKSKLIEAMSYEEVTPESLKAQLISSETDPGLIERYYKAARFIKAISAKK